MHLVTLSRRSWVGGVLAALLAGGWQKKVVGLLRPCNCKNFQTAMATLRTRECGFTRTTATESC